MAAVEVEDLVITYGSVRAVDGVTFEAFGGEVLALLGPNGAGKTSTVETLEGYQRPDSGAVRVLGADPWHERSRIRGRVGVMLQEGGVYAGIRPPEMLQLLAALYPDPRDPVELLSLVGLAERSTATWRQLSGGEQQRLGLAMAIIGRPEVAFLDEPTAGVDIRGRQVIREVIRDLAADGCAVVLCTHELDEAEKLADRVVIVDRGRVVGAGTLAELRASSVEEIRFSAAPGLDTTALAATVGAPVDEVTAGEYRIAGTSPEQVATLTAWLSGRGIALGDLRVGRHRLEDVFLDLTGGEDA